MRDFHLAAVAVVLAFLGFVSPVLASSQCDVMATGGGSCPAGQISVSGSGCVQTGLPFCDPTPGSGDSASGGCTNCGGGSGGSGGSSGTGTGDGSGSGGSGGSSGTGTGGGSGTGGKATLAPMLKNIDFSGAIVAILSVFGLIIGVFSLVMGGAIIIAILKGKDFQKAKSWFMEKLSGPSDREQGDYPPWFGSREEAEAAGWGGGPSGEDKDEDALRTSSSGWSLSQPLLLTFDHDERDRDHW